MRWYAKVVKDLSAVADAMEYFEERYEEANAYFFFNGQRLTKLQTELPGKLAECYALFYEVESILKIVEKAEEAEIVEKTKFYRSAMMRELSETMARKYAEAHEDVLPLYQLRLEVATMRNKFIAVNKGLDALNYQLSNITKLKIAGIEDATID